MQSIEQEYQKPAKKYRLPSFDSLNNEFEISDIEKEGFLLREIRRKITDKIENYIKLIEDILQPEANICDMHECRVINDEEKKKVYELYKKLMYLDRFSIETSINENDEKSSIFINEAFKGWGQIKKDFLKLVVKLKESWLKDTDIKEKLGYLG